MKKFLRDVGLAAGIMAGAIGGKAEAGEKQQPRGEKPGIEQVQRNTDKEVALEDQKAISAALKDTSPIPEFHKQRVYGIIVPMMQERGTKVIYEFSLNLQDSSKNYNFNREEELEIQKAAENAMDDFIAKALDDESKKMLDKLVVAQRKLREKLSREDFVKQFDNDPAQNAGIEALTQLLIRSFNAEKNKAQLATAMEDAMRIKAQEIVAKSRAK